MKLNGKQTEQIAHEIRSTQIEVLSINILPIGETCIAFKGVDGKYQAYFDTKTDVLKSLIQIYR
jgi:hypothetical protein